MFPNVASSMLIMFRAKVAGFSIQILCERRWAPTSMAWPCWDDPCIPRWLYPQFEGRTPLHPKLFMSELHFKCKIRIFFQILLPFFYHGLPLKKSHFFVLKLCPGTSHHAWFLTVSRSPRSESRALPGGAETLRIS